MAAGVGGRTAETARDPRARVRECGQGKEPPGSDLDVLIVSEGVPEDLEERADMIREPYRGRARRSVTSFPTGPPRDSG